MGFASQQEQEEWWEHGEEEWEGRGMLIAWILGLETGWILAGNCVDPDRIHHSKEYPMHCAPLPEKMLEKKKSQNIP